MGTFNVYSVNKNGEKRLVQNKVILYHIVCSVSSVRRNITKRLKTLYIGYIFNLI